MLPAGRPPVRGKAAAQVNQWLEDLIRHAAADQLVEDPEDEREVLLACASIARHLELAARDQAKRFADAAYERDATNTMISYALGVRAQTTAPRYPAKRSNGSRLVAGTAGFAGWRKRGTTNS